MSLSLILLIISALLTLFFVWVLYSRKSLLPRLLYSLLIFTLSVFLWQITLYLVDIGTSSILMPKLAFIFGGWTVVGALGISFFYPGNRNNKLYKYIFLPVNILQLFATLLMLLTDYIISGYSSENADVMFGVLGPVYLGILAVGVLSFLSVLIRRSSIRDKSRLYYQYATFSLVVFSVIALLSNLVFPSLGITNYISIVPLWAFIPIATITYTLVADRLYKLTYIFSHLVIYTIYFIVIFPVFLLLIPLDGKDIDFLLLRLVAAGMVSALIIAVLETLFLGKLRTRIKYGQYNPSAIKDELSVELGGELNSTKIVNKATEYLQKASSAGSIKFVFPSVLKYGLNLPEDPKYVFNDNVINVLYDEIPSQTIDVNRLTEETIILSIRKVDEEVALVTKFVGKTKGLVLFNKKSFNEPFTIEDIEALETVVSLTSYALDRSVLYAEVETFSQTLQQKVDEATTDLKEKNQTLKTLRERERDMMDIMGHELRTPLTIIKMTLGLLKTKATKNDYKFQKPDFDEYFKRMKDATDREVRLLETMLSSTKIDANKMEIHLEKIDLLPVVRDSILAHRDKAEEKDLKLKFTDPEVPVEIFADRVRFPEVMDNLVSNAVKYTDEGQVEVTIDTDSDDDMVIVTVSDTGRGIPEDAINRLGTKFYRVKQHLEKIHKDEGNSTSIVRPGGTGLGLYVSFNLVRLMGGEVKIESELGKGSKFTFTIPKFKDQKELDYSKADKDLFSRMDMSKEDLEKLRETQKDQGLSVQELLDENSGEPAKVKENKSIPKKEKVDDLEEKKQDSAEETKEETKEEMKEESLRPKYLESSPINIEKENVKEIEPSDKK